MEFVSCMSLSGLVVLLFCCPAGGAISQCCSFPWSLGLLALPGESVVPRCPMNRLTLTPLCRCPLVPFPLNRCCPVSLCRFPFPVGESQLWENLCFSPSFLPLACGILMTLSREMMVKDEESRWNCNFEACKGWQTAGLDEKKKLVIWPWGKGSACGVWRAKQFCIVLKV